MRILIPLFSFLHRLLRFFAVRLLPKDFTGGQFFANTLLRRYAPYFNGNIINVSGWDDRDMENSFYTDYFPHKTSYTVSNAPTKGKGFGSVANYEKTKEILLDLEQPLSLDLKKKFDVVLNICTLEHVFDLETAFKNLCALSNDVVILVVPAIQQIHILDYGDYWRMTTLSVIKKFQQYGFTTLVIKTNDQPFRPIFIFAIAVRDPQKYAGIITPDLNLEMGAALYGSSLKKRFLPDLLKK